MPGIKPGSFKEQPVLPSSEPSLIPFKGILSLFTFNVIIGITTSNTSLSLYLLGNVFTSVIFDGQFCYIFSPWLHMSVSMLNVSMLNVASSCCVWPPDFCFKACLLFFMNCINFLHVC